MCASKYCFLRLPYAHKDYIRKFYIILAQVSFFKGFFSLNIHRPILYHNFYVSGGRVKKVISISITINPDIKKHPLE